MDIKKIYALSLTALLSLTLVACSDNKLSEGEKSEPNKLESNQLKAEKEVKNENLKFKNYKEVLEFYKTSGGKVEKLLSSNNIDYIKSPNSDFIVSKEHQYNKFEKSYKQSFVSDTRVHYNDGIGYFNISIEKEFHVDVEQTMDDNYMKVMDQLYKEYFKKSKNEDFINEINKRVEGLKEAGGTSIIETEDGKFWINITIDGSTVKLDLNLVKPIEIDPIYEPIVKEYATIKEFDAVHNELEENNINNELIDKSKWNYIYTLSSEQNNSDDFSEEVRLGFDGLDLNKEYDYTEASDESSVDTLRFNPDGEVKTYLSKALDIYTEQLGFDVREYVTINQMIAELQAKEMREQSKLKGKTVEEFNISLPIPGFIYVIGNTYSPLEYYDDISSHKSLDELMEPNLRNKEVTGFSLSVFRPVVAEGITRK